MKKRILSILLAAVMLLTLLPVTAFADDPVAISNVEVADTQYQLLNDITVTLNQEVSSGTVKLYIDGTEYGTTKSITNSDNVVFQWVYSTTAGKHTVVAKYFAEGDTETPVAVSDPVEYIARTDPVVNVGTDGAIYGETLCIYASVEDNDPDAVKAIDKVNFYITDPSGNFVAEKDIPGTEASAGAYSLDNKTYDIKAEFEGLDALLKENGQPDPYSCKVTFYFNDMYRTKSYQPIPFTITKAQIDNITLTGMGICQGRGVTGVQNVYIRDRIDVAPAKALDGGSLSVVAGNKTLQFKTSEALPQGWAYDDETGVFTYELEGGSVGDYAHMYVQYNGNKNYKNAISVYAYSPVLTDNALLMPYGGAYIGVCDGNPVSIRLSDDYGNLIGNDSGGWRWKDNKAPVSAADSGTYTVERVEEGVVVETREVRVTIYEATPYAITNGAPLASATDNHGYITIDKTTAASGTDVTVTVTPDEGYRLKSLKYNDGEDHDITSAKSFTMPPKDVTVTAEFEKISGPEPDDDHDVDYEKLAKAGMVAAGVVAGVVVTKIVVNKLHEIKAAKDATAEATPEINVEEMPMVAMGSSGDAVTTLQTKLNELGYNCGEADGVFGQNTLNAVIAFQTAKGLTADGIVGTQTWAELLG